MHLLHTTAFGFINVFNGLSCDYWYLLSKSQPINALKLTIFVATWALPLLVLASLPSVLLGLFGYFLQLICLFAKVSQFVD